MTPKEKAKELVDGFYKETYEISSHWAKSDRQQIFLPIAIKSALIAVDELIYETKFEVPNIRQRYWLEVKQEIEKL